MIPDSLLWGLIRRRRLGVQVMGFQAHLLTYATPDCRFAEYVNLKRGTNLYSCQLGRATYVAGASLSNVITGKFCSIGNGARIGLGQHPKNFTSTHPSFYSNSNQTNLNIRHISDFVEAKSITLGNDVWIGSNSLVMDGISIGDGAIVGAGAVVTKNVPPYAIVVGSPSKMIRYRFCARTIELLESVQWWNFSDHEIKRFSLAISPQGPVDLHLLEHWVVTQSSSTL